MTDLRNIRHSAQLLEAYPNVTLALLAALAKSHRLDDAEEGWLRCVTVSVQAQLEVWHMSEDNVGMH